MKIITRILWLILLAASAYFIYNFVDSQLEIKAQTTYCENVPADCK